MNSQRVKTGVDRLDYILKGGIPRGSVVLLAGGPGTGKTILSARFLYSGIVDYNEGGMYVSFTETREAFKNYMLNFGWNFDELEKKGLFTFLDLFSTSEEGLDHVIKTILEPISIRKIKRLVIDSVTALSISLGERYKVRNIVYLLKQLLKQTDCTSIFVAEVPFGYPMMGVGIEEFVVDGVIVLELQREGYEFRRRIAVLKMRGTEHDLKYYRFDIQHTIGLKIMPILAE
ncbi:MAG: ATPase domain-containing protein [Nitrososphaerales archaeon]